MKAWLAFENETLESGPYDAAWGARDVQPHPTDGEGSVESDPGERCAVFLSLLGDRSEIAGVTTITTEEDIAWLREYAANETRTSSIVARDPVGAYTLKTCEVDVLKPFRDLAKGFE